MLSEYTFFGLFNLGTLLHMIFAILNKYAKEGMGLQCLIAPVFNLVPTEGASQTASLKVINHI